MADTIIRLGLFTFYYKSIIATYIKMVSCMVLVALTINDFREGSSLIIDSMAKYMMANIFGFEKL